MPPKGDPKKTHVGGGTGNDGKGSATGNGGNGNDGTEVEPRSVDSSVVIPPGSGFGTAPGQLRMASTSSAGDSTMEIDLTKDSAKDKVSSISKEFEKMFYAYGDQLMQATQDALSRATGVDADSAKAISSSWGQIKKAMQPKLNSTSWCPRGRIP
ncbi:hypothetical protein AAVH_08927 [Aphelenchoides avenae]|nr:hypothetical protein AAVH_08927 [Aphelenchus avenae]